MQRAKTEPAEPVAISLPKGTRLVLFEYLAHSYDVRGGSAKEQDDDKFVLLKPDAGERAALWHLEGAIESTLTEVFASNYRDLISEAKQRLTSN